MNASQNAQIAALATSKVKDRLLFRYVPKGGKFRFIGSTMTCEKTGRKSFKELPHPKLPHSKRRYQTGLNVIVVEVK